MAIALVIAALIFAPLIKRAYDERLRYDCGQNFRAISASLGVYMSNNDDRFPPTCERSGDTPAPVADGKGRPYTWASTLTNLAGFDPKRSFSCPAATPPEVMIAEGAFDPQTGGAVDLPMSYGMFAPYDAQPRSAAANAGKAIVIAETASGGANGTFDPVPMAPMGGKVRDGFLIGWATGDFPFPTGKNPPPVTRLAIPNSPKGPSSNLTQGRHDDRIYVLFADGHYTLMKVDQLASRDYWALPAR